MKTALALLLLTVSLGAARAEEAPAQGDVEQGFSLMQEGTRLLLRGLMSEVEPKLDAMLDEMKPAMRELGALMGDMTNYHAPEVLPNGDIIIRRKTPLPTTPPNGEIEL